jgi:hypothetical protein
VHRRRRSGDGLRKTTACRSASAFPTRRWRFPVGPPTTRGRVPLLIGGQPALAAPRAIRWAAGFTSLGEEHVPTVANLDQVDRLAEEVGDYNAAR